MLCSLKVSNENHFSDFCWLWLWVLPELCMAKWRKKQKPDPNTWTPFFCLAAKSYQHPATENRGAGSHSKLLRLLPGRHRVPGDSFLVHPFCSLRRFTGVTWLAHKNNSGNRIRATHPTRQIMKVKNGNSLLFLCLDWNLLTWYSHYFDLAEDIYI